MTQNLKGKYDYIWNHPTTFISGLGSFQQCYRPPENYQRATSTARPLAQALSPVIKSTPISSL